VRARLIFALLLLAIPIVTSTLAGAVPIAVGKKYYIGNVILWGNSGRFVDQIKPCALFMMMENRGVECVSILDARPNKHFCFIAPILHHDIKRDRNKSALHASAQTQSEDSAGREHARGKRRNCSRSTTRVVHHLIESEH
jgi:hypothetical protein